MFHTFRIKIRSLVHSSLLTMLRGNYPIYQQIFPCNLFHVTQAYGCAYKHNIAKIFLLNLPQHQLTVFTSMQSEHLFKNTQKNNVYERNNFIFVEKVAGVSYFRKRALIFSSCIKSNGAPQPLYTCTPPIPRTVCTPA